MDFGKNKIGWNMSYQVKSYYKVKNLNMLDFLRDSSIYKYLEMENVAY